MNNLSISPRDFPARRSNFAANWVPIYIEPVLGSGERICIGVAASDGRSIAIAPVPNVGKLAACLGPGASALQWAAELALHDVEHVARDSGLESLSDRLMSFQGLSIGAPREGAGIDLRDLASLALRQSSALCAVRNSEEFASSSDLLALAIETAQPNVVSSVRAAVVRLKPGLRQYFDRRFAPRQSARVIPFGYVSPTLAINYSTLSATSANGLTAQVDRAKARILDLESLRNGLLTDGLPVRRKKLEYELHVLRPDLPKKSESYALLREAENSLESQADRFDVRWRHFSTPASMADWLVHHQKAA